MTRRIRFTPLFVAGCFLAAGAVSRAETVPFVARPPLSSSLTSGRLAVSADFDRDGDPDVVAASAPGAVQLFRNTSGDGSAWTSSTITTLPFGAVSLVAADLDGDGDVDVLARDGATSTVRWYENAGAVPPWSVHTVSTLPYSATFVAAADLDRDGDLDVVAPESVGQRMRWFENTSGDGLTWALRTMATGVVPLSATVADLDDDGDPDVAAAGGADHLWFENTAGDGSAWTPRTLATAAGEQSFTASDLDRDGDLDLVAPTVTALAWFENVAGDGSAWTRRPIATGAGSLDAVVATDLDADGDPDLLASEPLSDRVHWYENANGDASSWVERTIATGADSAATVLADDLDTDGDLDVVAVLQGSGTLAWYRNETLHPNACFVPRSVATGVAGAQAVVPADVDGDGDLDAISTAFLAGAVLWHENSAGDASAFTTRTVASGFASATVAAAGDVDRDGDVDVAAIGAPVGAGPLAWFDNSAGNGSAWTTRTVSTAFNRATHVELSDVSGDGDLDLLGAGYYSQTLLFENSAGDGSGWTPVTLPSGAQTGLATGDLDGDGDLDVTSTESFFSDGLSWTENVSGTGSVWSERTISTVGGATYAMATADLDGDGDLDVLEPGANFLVGNAIWYENAGGGAGPWTPHHIPGAESSIAAVADFDRDGDVDVTAPVLDNFGASHLRWWENAAGSGLSWTQRAIAPLGGAPRQLATADLDRDGDADILSATAATSSVDWYENRGGQASLAVVDQAPAAANNGDLVPMLRATLTHLGRAGEGPVELASLGLLFEETAGDPLSSAEANALVESLRVYRDANGNGTFEPGTDALVTSVPMLVLTGGVATVVSTDGDANVQVAVGAPRAYFVVAEIAAAASGQVPNQFRVTLLQTGAARSVVEDRTFDLPLRLACPADVSSTVRQVVPVELSGFSIE
jgi:FG-GAP-like repeat